MLGKKKKGTKFSLYGDLSCSAILHVSSSFRSVDDGIHLWCSVVTINQRQFRKRRTNTGNFSRATMTRLFCMKSLTTSYRAEKDAFKKNEKKNALVQHRTFASAGGVGKARRDHIFYNFQFPSQTLSTEHLPLSSKPHRRIKSTAHDCAFRQHSSHHTPNVLTPLIGSHSAPSVTTESSVALKPTFGSGYKGRDLTSQSRASTTPVSTSNTYVSPTHS